MANYSIKDLENFTGIKAHTIRIWEKRYNVVEPKRTDTNIRYYDDEDLKKLLNVSILNRHGYKISNIANFTEQALCEKVLNLAQTNHDVESQIESMVLAMIDLDEQKFDKLFNNAVLNYGFEDTILKIIYPFFQKIGILWLIGTINPAQEHFISNLLRQKLILAIDGIVESLGTNSKTFLLFLPENEYHELGLLFYHYLLKKQNHKVYYLGESVPFQAIVETAKLKKFDAVVTAIVTSRTKQEIIDYLEDLSRVFGESTVYLTGHQAEAMSLELPKNIRSVEDVASFKKILNSI
jgi:DNA-binding transcriptional MerR regulator